MASFRKRGGRWQAIVKRAGRQYSRTFATKAAAQRWARETEVKLDAGEDVERRSIAERMTVKDALARYIEEVVPSKRHADTEKRRIRRLMQDEIARLPLAKVRSADVAAFRDRKLGAGRSANDVRLYLAILSHLFSVAEGEWSIGLPAGNPVRSVRKPSLKGTARDRRLMGDEEARLLAACDEYGGAIRDVVVFAIETAMRRGEIAGLRWPDVDLVTRVAHLPETKNGEARDVPLSSRAVEVLRRRSKVRTLHDDRVFGIAPNGISQAFSRVCRRAGIEDLRFHDLRHEATSRLFEKGLNPMQVSAITGHKTLTMLRRYTHLKASDLARLLG